MLGAVGNPLFVRSPLPLLLILALPLSACDFTSVPPPYSKGAMLQGGVHYVSSRRWKERGLEWLSPEGKDIGLVSEPPNGIGGDVTILTARRWLPQRGTNKPSAVWAWASSGHGGEIVIAEQFVHHHLRRG